MKKSKSVEEYISLSGSWEDALKMLRTAILSTGLVNEEVKWGAPCYTFEGKNIVGLAAFKSYVGIWFHQGALLKDEQNKLLNAQEGVTKAQRQWRFDSDEEVRADLELVIKYVIEACGNQKQGKAIKPEKVKETVVPAELQAYLDKDKSLLDSFEQFTPFKQREFCEYIETAKRAETKQTRLDKIIPMIKEGIGLNDKYR